MKRIARRVVKGFAVITAILVAVVVVGLAAKAADTEPLRTVLGTASLVLLIGGVAYFVGASIEQDARPYPPDRDPR